MAKEKIKWLKIIWWLILCFVASFYLFNRYDSIIKGNNSNLDLLVLLVLIGLLLKPLFNEVELFGVKLKNEVEEVKESIKNIKLQLNNAISVQSTSSPHFYMGPPPDSQLIEVEKHIREYLDSLNILYMKDSNINENIFKLDEDTLILFSTRYNIEKELKRIGTSADLNLNRIAFALPIARNLLKAEIIDNQLYHIIREIYAVCSPAVHGEEVTNKQVEFVKNVAPALLKALKNIY